MIVFDTGYCLQEYNNAQLAKIIADYFKQNNWAVKALEKQVDENSQLHVPNCIVKLTNEMSLDFISNLILMIMRDKGML